jgi:hypothetical protein
MARARVRFWALAASLLVTEKPPSEETEMLVHHVILN